MKLATLTASVLAVLACGSVLGCSSGRTTPPDTGARVTDTGGLRDTPFSPIDAPIPMTPDSPFIGTDSPPPRTDTGRPGTMCVATCTSDSQCQTSCPANPLGANCCDTIAGVCYAAMVAVCPASMPGDDAGGSGV